MSDIPDILLTPYSVDKYRIEIPVNSGAACVLRRGIGRKSVFLGDPFAGYSPEMWQMVGLDPESQADLGRVNFDIIPPGYIGTYLVPTTLDDKDVTGFAQIRQPVTNADGTIHQCHYLVPVKPVNVSVAPPLTETTG